MRRQSVGLMVTAITVVTVLAGCSAIAGNGSGHAGGRIAPVATNDRDWKGVANALGRSGTLVDGTVYRVSFPRRDLKVTSKQVVIKPALSLSSYAAFTRYRDGTTMVMGDLVVPEGELQDVIDALHFGGLEQTAVHKHLLAHTPPVWWAHFHAEDTDAALLARAVKTALIVTDTPSPSPPAQDTPDLDTAALDKAMGAKGSNDGGIYKFSFARSHTITAHRRVLPPAMGVTTAIGFQPTGHGRAAINGDFAMTAEEVQPVIQELRGGDIDIVELHNHALNDQPRLVYLHFWAHDDAVKLARTLKHAIAEHAVKPTG